MQTKKAISLLLTLVLVFGIFAGTIPSASAAEAGATLSVDLDPAVNTGKIIHGAAGFYMVSAVRTSPLQTRLSHSNRKFFAQKVL